MGGSGQWSVVSGARAEALARATILGKATDRPGEGAGAYLTPGLRDSKNYDEDVGAT